MSIEPIQLTADQMKLLERVLYTAQMMVENLLPKDEANDLSSDIHLAIMAFTMIKMDMVLLLTGEELFTKALQDVTAYAMSDDASEGKSK